MTDLQLFATAQGTGIPASKTRNIAESPTFNS